MVGYSCTFVTDCHHAWCAIRRYLAQWRPMQNVGPTALTAQGSAPVGFDWHAPLYQRPHAGKDRSFMSQSSIADDASPSPTAPSPFRWRRHPALRKPQPSVSEADDVPIALRQTHLAAVRGVQAAHDGRIAAAAQWFAEAVQDRAITLQHVPGFWECSRAGMQAAVDAYDAAERFRDSAALAAIIRTRYRPRALTPLRPVAPDPIVDDVAITGRASSGD